MVPRPVARRGQHRGPRGHGASPKWARSRDFLWVNFLEPSGRSSGTALLLRALTQAELAERAGVTTATVARIERAEIEPRMTTLRKLAQGLEVEPADLVEG